MVLCCRVCSGIRNVLLCLFRVVWKLMKVFGSRICCGLGRIVCSDIVLVVGLMVVEEKFSVFGWL